MAEEDLMWFVPYEERPDAARVVFGFPNAGGGCSSLGAVAAGVDPSIEFRTLNLPGRQARFLEEPRTDLAELVNDVADAVESSGVREFSFFGYCFGALLAYLVGCRLKEHSRRGPAALYVASLEAPGSIEPLDSLLALPNEALWKAIVRLGGVPSEIADDDAMREILEPALRADFALLAGHRQREPMVLDIPFVVLAGDRDEWISAGSTGDWASLTTSSCEVVRLDAGHWVADEAPQQVAALLSKEPWDQLSGGSTGPSS